MRHPLLHELTRAFTVIITGVILLLFCPAAYTGVGLMQAANDNQCLDANGQVNNVAAVYKTPCQTTNPNQNWVVTGNQVFPVMVHSQSGNCLSTNGTDTLLSVCDNWDSKQHWFRSGARLSLLVNSFYGTCLGTNLKMSTCIDDSTAVSWRSPLQQSGKLTNALTGKCMRFSATAGSVSLTNCDASFNNVTQFEAINWPGGTIYRDLATGRCMAATTGGSLYWTSVCNMNPTNLFYWSGAQGNRLESKDAQGKCLTATPGSDVVSLAACSSSMPGQVWTTDGLGLQSLYSHQFDQCFYYDTALLTPVGFEACDSRITRQALLVSVSGYIQQASSSSCMTLAADNVNITFERCGTNIAKQTWSRIGRYGLINASNGKCLNVGADADSPLTTADCNQTIQQNFNLTDVATPIGNQTGGIWGASGVQQAFTQDMNNWEYLASFSAAKMVSAARGVVWGLDSNNRVYTCLRPCNAGSTWSYASGSGFQIDVSTDGAEVYVVGMNNKIFSRKADLSTGWLTISSPFNVRWVSAGRRWLVALSTEQAGGSYKAYRCAQPCNGSWTLIEGALTNVDIRHGVIWGANDGGSVYSRPTDLSQGWTYVPTPVPMKMVSAGTVYVVALDTQDRIYQCAQPCRPGTPWDLIPGSLRHIDVE